MKEIQRKQRFEQTDGRRESLGPPAFPRQQSNEDCRDELEDLLWLQSPEAISAWADWVVSPEKAQSISRQLAKDRPTAQRRALLLQSQLAFLKTSREKFPDPAKWFWTRKLLEQSSDFWCAAETALDIPAGVPVLDLCCGAGADAIPISLLGHAVHAVDIDPIAIALTSANASAHQAVVTTHCRAVESLEIASGDFIHIDPDRRGGGARVTASDGFLPSWSCIEPMIESCLGISIKVAPATVYAGDSEPPHVIRFLSRNRSVRQQRWLWKQSRWPVHSIVVSACTQQTWHHEVFSMTERIDPFEVHYARSLKGCVGDYDPALRAAGVSATMADRVRALPLSENGYFTTDQPSPHPMVRWFRVLDVLPMDRKKLIAYSRTRPVRNWELKSRGVEFALEPLQKQLVTCPESEHRRTILFTKVGGKHTAIVAEEC